MKRVLHTRESCELCSTDSIYMRVPCVAEALGLSQMTIYAGEGGTSCLYAGRIKRGSNVMFLRCRVAAHQQLEWDLGECNGNCRKAKPPVASSRELRLVAQGAK